VADHGRALGVLGERLAEQYLTATGFRILERNFRTRYGEIDLVAADARCLVFCEVKSRVAGSKCGPEAPLDAIGPYKRRRLRRLASQWLRESAGRPRPHRRGLRFDAIGITLSRSGELIALEHVQGAF
jgi:putative endonuclease